MQWYFGVWRKYAVFGGRASRAEFWTFVLFNLVAESALIALDLIVFGTQSPIGAGAGVFSAIYSLAVFLPALGVTIRRLHDVGRTGWWVLIGLVPLLGLIVLVVFCIGDSQPNENRYGPNPKLNPY